MYENSTHCIVILYEGKDIPDVIYDDVAEKMVGVLAARGIAIPELVTFVYKDSEGIAGSLAKDVLLAKEGNVAEVANNPIENALIYLSRRYENELKDANLTAFILKLSTDIHMHRFAVSRGKEGDIMLMNALEILCTKTVHTDKLQQYGISERAMNAMHQCYNYSYV